METMELRFFYYFETIPVFPEGGEEKGPYYRVGYNRGPWEFHVGSLTSLISSINRTIWLSPICLKVEWKWDSFSR